MLNKVVTTLNNRTLIAIVVGLTLLAMVRSFARRR